MRTLASWILAAFCLLLWATPCPAADPGAIKEKISEKNREVERLGRKEVRVIQDLEETDRELARSMARKRELDKRIAGLSVRMAEAEQESRVLEKGLVQRKSKARVRVAAYYRLCQTGALPALSTANDFLDAVTRQNALRRILQADKLEMEALNRDLIRRRELADRLREDAQSVKKLKDAQAEEISGLAAARDRKRKILGRVKNEKALAAAALESLREAARELEKTLEKARREQAGKSAPQARFSARKGRLPMPAQGRIVEADAFGAMFRNGVIINARMGEPVRAVGPGVVAFSGWFRGYGNMIIIDHGDHYYSISAHAEDLFKEKGDPVEAGEVVATVGDTGTNAGPGLYFELRHHQEPLDPAQWLAKGTR